MLKASRPGHPEPLQLQSYADGELPVDDARGLESHLRDCAACARQVSALRGLASQLSTLPDAPLSRDLSRPVEVVLRRRRPRRALPWVAALELMAGVAIVAWAWPLAEQSANALASRIQGAGLAAAHRLLSTWTGQTESLLTSFTRAVHFDLARALPSLGLAQAGILVAAVAVLWAAGNFVLLRKGAAEGLAR
jgi:anti-sigma factor RsiW